jgi:hypothetical protein
MFTHADPAHSPISSVMSSSIILHFFVLEGLTAALIGATINHSMEEQMARKRKADLSKLFPMPQPGQIVREDEHGYWCWRWTFDGTRLVQAFIPKK